MHSKEAWENRRRNIECDHTRALLYGQPLKDEREGPKHYLVRPAHVKDHVWDVIESNREASMAELPNRRGGRKHYGRHRLVASHQSPYGTSGTTPDPAKPRLRQIRPPMSKKEIHHPKKRTGYPQDRIHQTRNVAFGDFGTPEKFHTGKGGYKEDRRQIHDHLKLSGCVPETPTTPSIHHGKRHIHDSNRSHDIISHQIKDDEERSDELHQHKRVGRASLVDHVVGDHTASILPTAGGTEHLPPPPPGIPHHGIRGSKRNEDQWMNNERPKERQHKLAVHDHNAEHIGHF